MYTHNQCFRAKKFFLIIFNLKINIFTVMKYCCIPVLHGRVCIMIETSNSNISTTALNVYMRFCAYDQ